MANSNEIQLVVTVEVDRANRSIKSVNANLSGIEAAATKSANAASHGIDGMTASMVKGATAGNLFADAIKQALDFAREWTIEATRYAARTETLGIVTHQLAKVNGYAAGFVDQLVDRLKTLGITTQEAHGVVQRMIFAQLDLSKATELARVAQDAAVIAGTDSSEALENIILGITTGQTRLLHNMGLQVSLVRTESEAELKLGHSLSETERRAAMLDKVLTEGTKIRGTYAAAMETVGKQVTSLPRYFAEAKNALGSQFLPEMRAVVSGLKELAGWVQNNADLLAKFGRVAVATAAMIATATLVSKIGAITSAVQGLTAALLANPWALLAAGVVAAGAIIYKTWSDTQAGLERGYEEIRRKTIQQDLFHGKLKLDDVRKMGYTDDQIREIVTGRRLVPGESWPDFSGPKITVAKGPSEEDLRRIAEERKRRADAERGAQEDYLRAVEQRKSAEVEMTRSRIEDSLKIIAATSSETEAAKESLNVVLLSRQEYAAGVEKIRQEEKREIEQRSSYTDEKTGVVRHFQLSQSALESIHKATAERIAAFDMRFNEEESRRIEAMLKAAAARSRRLFDQLFVDPMKQQLYLFEQTSAWQEKIADQARAAGLAAVDQCRDIELAQLDAVNARTLADKVALENAKTAIEVRAIRERARIEMEQIDAETERQVAEARKSAMAQGIFYEPYLQQIESKIRELGQHEKDVLQKAATSEVDVTQVKGAIATRKIVTDEYRNIFQTLKQEAGGVFDALVTKSQSVWSAIGNSLKTALLTAIKDVVTSRVAAMLMQLFVPGASVEMRQSGMGGGGVFGKLGGILGVGAVPVFAGGAGGTPPFVPSGSAAGLGTILPQVLGPGGTPPFVPSATGAGAGMGAAPAAGGMLSKAGLGGHPARAEVLPWVRRKPVDRHGRRPHGDRGMDRPVWIVRRQTDGAREIKCRTVS